MYGQLEESQCHEILGLGMSVWDGTRVPTRVGTFTGTRTRVVQGYTYSVLVPVAKLLVREYTCTGTSKPGKVQNRIGTIGTGVLVFRCSPSFPRFPGFAGVAAVPVHSVPVLEYVQYRYINIAILK